MLKLEEKLNRDASYQKLSESIKIILKQNNWDIKIDRDEFTKRQKEHVESLFKAEINFKNIFRSNNSSKLRKMYQHFIDDIQNRPGKMRQAKPFFRCTSNIFSPHIVNAIKNQDLDTLMAFHPNFNLIEYIFIHSKTEDKQITEAYNKIRIIRQKLLENTLPLAIYEAKRFFDRTPASNIELEDMIGTATVGLTRGIDKYYAKEYTTSFRAMCIGRIRGLLIKEYSETFLKFNSDDKKILYRLNIIKNRQKKQDFEELYLEVNNFYRLELINDGSYPKIQNYSKEGEPIFVTKTQLLDLTNKTNILSIDSQGTNDDEEDCGTILSTVQDESDSAEEILIKKEQAFDLQAAIKEHLSYLKQKIIKLKGVTFD